MTGDDYDMDELGEGVGALMALAHKSLGQLSPAEHARGREAVRSRLARRRQRTVFWSLTLTATGLAAAAALLLAPRLHRRAATAPALAYRLDGAVMAADGAIEPRGDAAPELRFGDGTVIALARGTRGRLASVDAHGAHLAISDGSASVSVVPKPRAHWRVDAGPFVIYVHGTVFTAAWSEASKRLDVKLERGAISVEGPMAGGPVAMRAGQHLTVAMRESRVVLRAIGTPETDTGAADTSAPPLPRAAATPRLGVAPPRPTVIHAEPAAARAETRSERAAAPGRSWTAALTAGDFGFIVADAERDLPRALRAASSDDLAALADAARYQRRDDLARRALEAQRRRFHGSPRATDAAFFLGRLDENNGGGTAQALRWYDQYLDEAPTGSYAAEALGRKMMAMRELYGVAIARDVADDYVRRFPHGSYVGAAQALRTQARDQGR